MRELDHIQINFSESQIEILNICLAFLMFGVALEIEKSHFKVLLQNPKPVIIGLTAQYILLPILTIILIYFLSPSPSLVLGMLLIAACPGGNISSYASNIAKANVSLSIVLTTISSLSCVITTPLLFTITSKLFLKVDSMNFEISFLEMMQSVSKIVLLPLIIGVYLNIKFPNSVKKVLPYVKMLSFLIFIGFIIAAVMGNLDNLYRHIHIVFLIVIAHNLLGLFGGYFFSRAFQLNETDARTIAIEVGIQNSGLALVLIFNFFDRNGGMSLIAAWWSIWHLISALGLARYWQWRDMSTRSALI